MGLYFRAFGRFEFGLNTAIKLNKSSYRDVLKLLRLTLGVAKKLWGWILKDEIQPLSFSELQPLKLSGNFDLGQALGKYSEKEKTRLGKLIYHFKYRKNKRAGEILVDLSSQFLKQNYPDFDVIVPVPPAMASTHFFVNRFFSKNLAEKLQKPLEKQLLSRIKFAPEQKIFRNLKDKRENVRNSFKLVEPQKVKDKTILVVDDIYDTGATVNEITSLLKSALAQQVFVFTIAKTSFYD